MTEYWLDYSAGRLDGGTIRNAGYTGVIRYVDGPALTTTKHVTRSEYQNLVAHGLHVQLYFENNTSDPDGGFNAGRSNALRALAGAETIGYYGIVYFTNDRTELPNVHAWQEYLDGAASILGRNRVGAYGFGSAIDTARGHAVAFVQAGRHADIRPHVNFWQDNNYQPYVGGLQCDRLEVISIPIEGVDDLTPEQDNRLKVIEQLGRSHQKELTGSPTGEPTIESDMRTTKPGNVPGWPSLVDHTQHTLVNFTQLIDKHTCDTNTALAALSAKVDALVAKLSA